MNAARHVRRTAPPGPTPKRPGRGGLRAAAGIALAVALGATGLVVAPPQALASAAGPLDSAMLYVSDAAGSDTDVCQLTAPCRTISHAVDLAGSWFTDGFATVTINIAAGRYIETLDTDFSGRTLVLQGAGAGKTVIDADGSDTVITVTSGTVRVHDLTITGGDGGVGGGSGGGGLDIHNAIVYLDDTEVADNRATVGAAARLSGTSYLEASRSTFSTSGAGGVTMLEISGGTVRLFQSTVDSKRNALGNHGTVTIDSSTIRAGSSLSTAGGEVRMYRSIIDVSSCSGTSTVDEGYNVVTDADCKTTSSSTVSSRQEIGLQPLADNGTNNGTQTMALAPDSTASSIVPLALCEVADQRGDFRPGPDGATHCDAGAFELHYVPRTDVYVQKGAANVSTCFTPQAPCDRIQEGVELAQRELRAGASKVTVHVGAARYLERVLIDVTDGVLVLAGAGTGRATIEAESGRRLTVRSGEVEIRDLTINSELATPGGGLRVDSDATVRLVDSEVTGGAALDGFGLGGGIYNAGELTVTRSALHANQATRGAAIYSTGTLTIDSSTIDYNRADESGSALFTTGPATIASSTIQGEAGGTVIHSLALTTISSSTITNGNIVNPGSATWVLGSILDVTCTGVNDGGYNVTTSDTCQESSSSVLTEPAGLGLDLGADNGGPTQTMAIGPASAARGVVPSARCDDVDQRGEPRPGTYDRYCDAGAFELQRDAVATDYYANAANGRDRFTCTKAETPCRTVAAALDAAMAAVGIGRDAVTVHVAPGTYTGALWVEVPDAATITIDGAGAASTVVDAGGDGSAVRVSSGNVRVRGLTLTGGDAQYGGGLMTLVGTDVELVDTHVTGNNADYGGGIFSLGTLTVTSSTLSKNTATIHGSALVQAGGKARFVRSTIAGDGAKKSPLIRAGGSVALVSSTISDGWLGGGTTGGTGGLDLSDTGTITVGGSILSDVVCVGNVHLRDGHNVVSTATCSYDASGKSLPDTVHRAVDIGLAPLGHYGSPTPTMPPRSDSPAVGLGAVQLVNSSLRVDTASGAVTASVRSTEVPEGMPTPAGTVRFTDDRGVVPGCAAVPVTGTEAVCPGLPFGPVTARLTAVNGYHGAVTNDPGVTVLGLSPLLEAITTGRDVPYTVTAYGPQGTVLGDVTDESVLTMTGGRCTADTCTATANGVHTVTATRGSLQTTARLTTFAPVGSGPRTIGPTRYEPIPLPPLPPKGGGILNGVPDTATFGEVIELTVTGFATLSPITFGIYSTPRLLATVNADATGSATVELTLPADLTGEHTLVAIGTGPDGEVRHLSKTVTIAASDDEGPVANGGAGTEDPASDTDATATSDLAPTETGPTWLPFAVVGFGLLLLLGVGVLVRSARRRTA